VEENEGMTTRTVEDTRNFAEKGTNPFGSVRDFNVEEFLDSTGIA
jgi:hypothetical protein